MKVKTCNTCRSSSKIGVDLFDIHICKGCLKAIEDLEMGEINYDYYKFIISNAGKKHLKAKFN